MYLCVLLTKKRCSPDDEFELFHTHAAVDACAVLSLHPLSNFVVQTYIGTVRNVAQARQVLAMFVPKRTSDSADAAGPTIGKHDSSVIQKVLKVRSFGGLLWIHVRPPETLLLLLLTLHVCTHDFNQSNLNVCVYTLGICLQADRYSVVSALAKLVVRFDTRQERLFSAVLDACMNVAGLESTAASEDSATKVTLLTILNVDASAGGEHVSIRASVPRAQLVGSLLDMEPTVCRPLVVALASLEQTILEQFALNTEVSRGVLEPFIGGDATRFAAERRQLLRRLLPVYV